MEVVFTTGEIRCVDYDNQKFTKGSYTKLTVLSNGIFDFVRNQKYKTKVFCTEGTLSDEWIEDLAYFSVKSNIKDFHRFEVYQCIDDKWKFRMVDKSGDDIIFIFDTSKEAITLRDKVFNVKQNIEIQST